MELILFLVFPFIAGPIGVLLIVMSAIALRDVRPLRAKSILALFAVLLIGVIATFAVNPQTQSLFTKVIEWGFIAVGVAILLLELALLIPTLAERTRATKCGYIGLVLVFLALAAFREIATANFSY